MNVEIFSILDAAAERFMDPFAAPSIGFALRGFREACETPGHQFAKFPEDYTLFHVGSFDAELGVLTGHNAAKIALASNFTGIHGEQLDIEGRAQA